MPLQFKLRRTRAVIIALLCALTSLASFKYWPAQKVPAASARPKSSPRIANRGEAESPASLSNEDAIKLLKQQGTYDSLAEAMTAVQYSIHRAQLAPRPDNEGAYTADNPAQALRADFNGDRTRVTSSGQRKWQIGLKLKGYGYGKNLLRVTSGEMKAQDNRIEISKHAVGSRQSASLSEWYVNKPA